MIKTEYNLKNKKSYFVWIQLENALSKSRIENNILRKATEIVILVFIYHVSSSSRFITVKKLTKESQQKVNF